MRQKEKLTRYAINRLKGLMAKEIKLVRVYPYESHSNDILAATSYSEVRIQKDSLLYKRLFDIRRIAEKYNLSDEVHMARKRQLEVAHMAYTKSSNKDSKC